MTTEAAREVFDRWEAEEGAVRSRHGRHGATFGVAPAAELAGKPGLDFFRAMFAGKLPFPPISESMDFIAVEVEKGHAVFQGRPHERFYNPMGTIHGGWFATLLDSAMGCAVHASLPAGKSYTTLEIKINILRALSKKVPLVRAEGRAIHVGGQVATAEGRLVGPDGKLYAHGTTTCLVFQAQARS